MKFPDIGDSKISLGISSCLLGQKVRFDGNHKLEATLKVGISVYGYGDYTSYWYPGGLDLAEIPVE